MNFEEFGPFVEDNQPIVAFFQAQHHQFAEVLREDELIIRPDGMAELDFSSLPCLLRLVKMVSPKINSFSNRLKKIEGKNDMRALNKEILGKDFSRALQSCLKRDSALSAVHSLLKKPLSSFEEFYYRVISIYTLNTNLPKRLNGLLKGEVFNKDDDLLPLLICLCEAFLCPTLKLEQVNGVSGNLPLNFYQEVEDNQVTYFRHQKLPLKEFWVMKTKKPDFLNLINKKNVKIYHEGSYYEVMKPIEIRNTFSHPRYIRTYLHVKVSKEAAKNLNYSPYLKLVKEKVGIIKEGNKIILAPGCDFVVQKLIEIPVMKIKTTDSEEDEKTGLEERIRIIKLTIFVENSPRVHSEEEEEEEEEKEEYESNFDVEETEKEPEQRSASKGQQKESIWDASFDPKLNYNNEENCEFNDE